MAAASKDNPADLVARLREPFPLDLIYARQGPGGKTLDYVSIETVLARLLDVDPLYSIVGKVESTSDNTAVVSVQLEAAGKT